MNEFRRHILWHGLGVGRLVVTLLIVLCPALFPVQARGQTPSPASAPSEDGPPIALTCVGLMVPAVVHVQARVPIDDPVSPLDCRYEWNFGDPGSAYNDLPGWNAAHVYDKPGQYTITSVVRQAGGRELKRTTWVRVAPDHRPKVHVSNEGNDGADGRSPSSAVRSVGRAMQLSRDGDAWVLFRRGDVFPITTSVNLNGNGLRFGNYDRQPGDNWATGVQLQPPTGSAAPTPAAAGALPVLKKIRQVPGQDSFFNTSRCEDLLVQGLEFDSIWDLQSEFGPKKIPARAFTVGGTNIGFRWCSFKNLTDAINTELRPTGVLVEGCTFSNEIRGYCIYANGTDHVYLGNVMRHSRQEHLIRSTEPGTQRLLIADNDLRRRGTGKGSIELRHASWFCVADNYLREGSLRIGPQDEAMRPGWQSLHCDWGVVQDNRLDDLFFHVRLGSYHMVFRNNVVRAKDVDWSIIVACEKKGFDEVRKVGDVRIEHNTVINLGTKGIFCFVQGVPVGLRVRQNVYIAPNIKAGGSNAGIYASKGLEGFTEIAGNLLPEGPGGENRIEGKKVDRKTWAAQSEIKDERYAAIDVDSNDNVPLETEAGALVGGDKERRDAYEVIHPVPRP